MSDNQKMTVEQIVSIVEARSEEYRLTAENPKPKVVGMYKTHSQQEAALLHKECEYVLGLLRRNLA